MLRDRGKESGQRSDDQLRPGHETLPIHDFTRDDPQSPRTGIKIEGDIISERRSVFSVALQTMFETFLGSLRRNSWVWSAPCGGELWSTVGTCVFQQLSQKVRFCRYVRKYPFTDAIILARLTKNPPKLDRHDFDVGPIRKFTVNGTMFNG